MLLAGLLQGLKLLFELSDITLKLGVIFLLQNELKDQILTVGLLLFKLALQSRVVFAKFTVFGLRTLSNIRNELKVMMQFVFSLSLFSCFISTLGLFLLVSFLRA